MLYLLGSWRATTKMGGPGALVRGNICMGEVSLIGMRLGRSGQQKQEQQWHAVDSHHTIHGVTKHTVKS